MNTPRSQLNLVRQITREIAGQTMVGMGTSFPPGDYVFAGLQFEEKITKVEGDVLIVGD